MKIKVCYTDGNDETYKSIKEAEDGIEETVLGCDFATTVDHIEVSGKGAKDLGCRWSVKLVEIG